MKEQTLHKGNDLKAEINQVKTSIKSIVDTIKDIELSNYFNGFIRIRAEQKECTVERDRFLKFMHSELKISEKDLERLEAEFEKL